MDELERVQDVIHTPRLDLHHISANDLITLFEEPENLLIYENKPYANPYRVLMDETGPLAWRVPQVKVDPTLIKWFVRWIVLRETGEIIGSASFHSAPNPDGMIEIGLGIHEQFRNRGFARESLKGMWLWVLSHPEVKTLRYTVSPENLLSVRVVQSFGFEYRGQQIDEEDGPEDIYEMSGVEFLTRYAIAEAEPGELA
ncbi:MAG: GNAT family N-acetyltransferase [Actinobacteria bacterium]|nr:GNAT family N-acetyltransferase [Actinomycetota bacterium]